MTGSQKTIQGGSISKMDEITEEEQLEIVYGEDFVDVTDDVMCYEKGKVFQCDCEQDFGVEHDRVAVKCPRCRRHVVDRDADERGPPDREHGQTGLGDWT